MFKMTKDAFRDPAQYTPSEFRHALNIEGSKAREYVVSQHPEMGLGELSRALGFKDHSGIAHIRKRLAAES